MPLIRYRTQDYCEIREGIVCDLEGREQEFLTTRSGAKLPGISIMIDQFTWDYVEVLQVVQNEPGKVEFHVKPLPQYEESVGQRILASQQAKWGEFFDLSLVVTDRIERTPSGKIRNFVVNVPEHAKGSDE
jgi:phenylacetate-CoA ligase